MSNPNFDFSHPQQQPERRGPSLLLVLLGVGCFLFLGGLMVAVLIAVIVRGMEGQGGGPAVQVVEVLDDASPAERAAQLRGKYREVSSAYEQPSLGDSPEDRQVVELFRKLSIATGEEDQAAFERLIDKKRYAREALNGSYWFSGGISANDLAEQMGFPMAMEGERVELVSVKYSPDKKTAVAYSHVWSSEIAMKLRWWVTLEKNVALIYDWEVLDFGMRDTRETWLLLNADESPALKYHKVAEDIQNSDMKIAGYDMEIAEKYLRAAGKHRVPSTLEEIKAIQMGFGWSRYGDQAEAFKWYELADDSGATPGAEWGKAVYYQEVGKSEEGLAAIEKYEGMVGRGPDSSVIRAKFLTDLKREQEANAVYLQIVQAQPLYQDALRYLVVHATEETQPQLFEHFKQIGNVSDDPNRVEQVIETLQSITYSADPIYLQAALDELRRTADKPQEAALHNLEGTMLERAREYDRAAAAYLRAAASTDHPELQDQYRNSYFYLMHTANRYSEAYEKAENKQRAFAFYLRDLEYDYEEYLPDWAREKLIAKHAARFPDDPYLRLAQAEDLIEQKKYVEAMPILKRLHEEADDDYQNFIDSNYIIALVNQGRGVVALRECRDEEGAFGRVCMEVLASEKPEQLAQVVEAHAIFAEDDPLIQYYRAKNLERQEKWDEAYREVSQVSKDDLEEEYAYAQYLNLGIEMRLKAGLSPREILSSEPEVEAVFNYLAGKRRHEQRWDELESLLSAPQVSQKLALPYRAALFVARDQDVKLIELLTPWPPSELADAEYWEINPLRDAYFNALLRTGREKIAKQVAAKVREDDDDAGLLAAYFVQVNDESGLEKLLKEYDDSTASNLIGELLNHELVGEKFRIEEYRSVRDQYPPSLYNLSQETSWTMLLDRETPLEKSEVERVAKQLLGESATVTPLAELPGVQADQLPKLGSFLIQGNGRRLTLARLPRDEQIDEEYSIAPKTPELIAAIEKYRAVDVLAESQLRSEVNVPLPLRTFAAAWGERDGVLAHAPSTLIANNAETRAALLDDSRWEAHLAQHSEPIYLWYENALEPEATNESEAIARAEQYRLREQAIDRAISAFRPGGEPLVVAVENSLGPIRQRTWVEVDEVSNTDYGGKTLSGTIREDSSFYPEQTAGTRVKLNRYQVRAVE